MATNNVICSKQPMPAFLASLGNIVINSTGDGTAYTMIFNTEHTDITSNYNNATGIFTCSETGLYRFEYNINYSSNSGGTNIFSYIVVNGIQYGTDVLPAYSRLHDFMGLNEDITVKGSCICQLAATQTAYIVIISSGGAKDSVIMGIRGTNFSGYRIY